MRQLSRLQSLTLQAGALVLLAGVALTGSRSPLSAVLFGLGALMFCPMMMLARYEGKNITILRLRRQQLFGLGAILVSAVLYVMEIFEWGPYALRHNYWLVALAVGCVFLVYSVFRLSYEIKKESKR